MHFYDDWAQRILNCQLTDHLAFYGLPGYAYLLAALYKIVGYGPFIPALLQALLDAGTAVLIYKVSIGIFSGTGLRHAQIAGVLAAVGWAFFVPAQTYAVVLMPTAWFVFIFWLILWRIVSRKNAPTKWGALILGLLVGLAATAIATILFLIPLVIGAILLKPAISTHSQFRTRINALVLLFLGAAAGTSPCWVHNCFIAHDRVFLSAHSGIYFGLVAALALPAIFLVWKTAPLSRWIAVAIALHVLALLPVFTTERYRLPIVPGLLIFAAFGLVAFFNHVVAGKFRWAVAYAAFLIVSSYFISWPQRDPSLWALDAYNSGWQALESGNLPLAERKLQLARAYVPTNPETNFALGNLRLAEGNSAAASTFYLTTLQLDDRHRGPL